MIAIDLNTNNARASRVILYELLVLCHEREAQRLRQLLEIR